MGQKVNPVSFRLVRTRDWSSKWYASKKEFGDLLLEDFRIRSFLAKKTAGAGVARIRIKRMGGKVEVTIESARPGLLIGKQGAGIDALKADLTKLTGREVWVAVEEVKRPDVDAKIVADTVARQLEKRGQFRRIMKKAMQSAKDAGALGVKVRLSGRIGGAEIARTEWYQEGKTPLHTLRANIKYAKGRAETTYGSLGVQVWIYLGEDNLERKEI